MILAAGFGTRLRPLTDRIPKPLVEVGGHPMIAYPLATLREAGVKEVLINLHHLGDQIRRALSDGAKYGLSIHYSEENPILDTGGAIQAAESFLGGDTFVVLNSDTIMDLPLLDAVETHRRKRALATMVLRPDTEARGYGLIEIDRDSRIRRFVGKPAEAPGDLTPLMFAGVHVFEPDVFSYMQPGCFGINAETYPAMLAAGARLFGHRFEGYWRVLDTHEGLAEGRQDLEGYQPIATARRP